MVENQIPRGTGAKKALAGSFAEGDAVRGVLVCVRLQEIVVELGGRVGHGSNRDVGFGAGSAGSDAAGAEDFVFNLDLLQLLLESLVFLLVGAAARLELRQLRL